jgi:hypothetical protein
VNDRPLCASPRCHIPNRHREDCDTATCRGCLPARAADGSRLCPLDIRRLGENATKAAVLYDELALVLKATQPGGHTSTKPGPGGPPRDAVVEQRATIRHVLVSWCRLISEERGIALPGDWLIMRLPRGVQGPWNREWVVNDTTPAHAAYIARHAEWLAACDYADEAADELAGLANRAYGLAYPSGTRRVEVGPCPLCDGTLTAIVRATDGVLPSEVVCDRDEDPHRWAADQWRHLDRLVMAKRRVVA